MVHECCKNVIVMNTGGSQTQDTDRVVVKKKIVEEDLEEGLMARKWKFSDNREE